MFGICRAKPADRPDGIPHLILNVWRMRVQGSRLVKGKRIFAREERRDTPGWIAALLAALEAGEPTPLLLDFIRDNGLTVETEEA